MPDFWNRPELDAVKPFASKERLVPYIAQFRREYEAVIRPIVHGDVVELGCGTGWLAAWMTKELHVRLVVAVDSSKHRIGMFERTFEWLKGRLYRTRRLCGDYHLNWLLQRFDCVVMCAFFHHVDPTELLVECKRLLKPGGWLCIIGEQPVAPLQVWIRRLRRIVFDGWHPKLTRFEDLFPVDEESGDRYYRKQDYERLFDAAGWEMEWIGKGIRAKVAR